jgi:chromosomal replication initiation ATPase DnaA
MNYAVTSFTASVSLSGHMVSPCVPPVEPARDPMHWKRILEETAEKHSIRVADLTGPYRHREFSWPRQEAMWRMQRETRMSMPAIGRRLGGRDHTTVLHGIRQHQKRLDEGRAG